MHTREGIVAWPDDLVARYREHGYWDGVSLSERFEQSAARSPDSVALVDGEVRLTYRELAARVEAASGRLGGLGLERDDRVIVQLPSSWQFVVQTLTCLRLGIVLVMALVAHPEHELTYLAELSEAVAIAVPDQIKSFDHQDLAETVADRTPSLRTVLVMGDQMRAMGVAAFKLPEHLVVVDRLPLTKVGKIDKKALRDHVAALAAHAPQEPGGRR